MQNQPPDPATRTSRPWWRVAFSLRFLMLVVLVVGGLLGWKIRRASLQRRAVATVKAAGGTVLYDYQAPPGRAFVPGASPATPAWLRRVAGDELFQEVAALWLENPRNGPPEVTPQALAAVQEFDHLSRLYAYYVPMDDRAISRLARLTSLRELTLLDIQATRAGLAEIGAMPNLIDLSPRNKPGNLPGSSLKALAGMKQLRKLEILGIDPIEAADLDFLAGMTNLTYLRLLLSPEQGNWAQHVQHLTKLTILDFRETRATDADLAALAPLTKLKTLLLDGSEVTDAGLAHLVRFPLLNTLHLFAPDRPGRITDVGLMQLAGLKQLEDLNLDATNLTGAGFAQLAALPIKYLTLTDLRSEQETLVEVATRRPLAGLSLEGPGVTDDWLNLLTNQSQLTNLGLNNTNLTDAGMAKIRGLFPRLTFLSLDSTATSDVGLMSLTPATPVQSASGLGNGLISAGALRSISALGTKVTPAGVDAFHKIRPNVKIEIGPVVPWPRHKPRATP